MDAYEIKAGQICLAVLEKPLFEQGFMETSHIENQTELIENRYKVINFPERTVKDNKLVYHEKIRNFSIKSSSSILMAENGFLVKSDEITGSMICLEKNGYLTAVGLQINGEQALLFDKKLHSKIDKQLINILKKNKKLLVEYFKEESEQSSNSSQCDKYFLKEKPKPRYGKDNITAISNMSLNSPKNYFTSR